MKANCALCRRIIEKEGKCHTIDDARLYFDDHCWEIIKRMLDFTVTVESELPKDRSQIELNII